VFNESPDLVVDIPDTCFKIILYQLAGFFPVLIQFGDPWGTPNVNIIRVAHRMRQVQRHIYKPGFSGLLRCKILKVLKQIIGTMHIFLVNTGSIHIHIRVPHIEYQVLVYGGTPALKAIALYVSGLDLTNKCCPVCIG